MGLAIGVDIGGTKIAAGVVDDEGNVLAKGKIATPARDSDAVVESVVTLVKRFLETHPDVQCVGIGAAGLVDSDRSIVRLAPNLGWTDVPLRAAVENATGLSAVVENDANAAAWGEYRFGAGRGYDDLCVVTVGTGIGGGLIAGGKLQRGSNGMAAEFGHLRVERDGRMCGCDRPGCWEQYASGNALVRTTRAYAYERRAEANLLLSLGDGTPEGIRGKDITKAALAGDPVALEAFDELGHWLGYGMAELAAVLDPTAFVIGGGVSEAGDILITPTRNSFLENVVGRQHRGVPAIVGASLGNTAGLVGAADLGRQI